MRPGRDEMSVQRGRALGLLAVCWLVASGCAPSTPDASEEDAAAPSDVADTEEEAGDGSHAQVPETDADVQSVTGPEPSDPSRSPGDGGARDARSADAGSRQDAGSASDAEDASAGGEADPGDASTGGDGGADASSDAPAKCCQVGDCVCRGDSPVELTYDEGPYEIRELVIENGCITYPVDAEPPLSAIAYARPLGAREVAVCGTSALGEWDEFLASHGFVVIDVIDVAGSSADGPSRAVAFAEGIAALKRAHGDADSPLYQRLAGRYGVMGASVSGGAATYAAHDDPSLRTHVAVMPWEPVRGGVAVPSLLLCGSHDTLAPCSEHGDPFYAGLDSSLPRLKMTLRSAHTGQSPSNGGGMAGKVVLGFQKLYLDGDERYRPLLEALDADHAFLPP